MKRFSVLLLSLSLLIITGLYLISITDKKRQHNTMSLSAPLNEIKESYNISVEVLNWFF